MLAPVTSRRKSTDVAERDRVEVQLGELLVELRLRGLVGGAAALLGGGAGIADLADVRPVRRVTQDVIVRESSFLPTG
jgi:hypothetical protein